MVRPMMSVVYPAYDNSLNGPPIRSFPSNGSYQFNIPGPVVRKQISYGNWYFPSMKRKMYHYTSGKKMIRCAYNVYPQFPLYQQPQQQSNFTDMYSTSFVPYGLRNITNTIPGSLPINRLMYNDTNNNMINDYMQMLQTQSNMHQYGQTDDQQNQHQVNPQNWMQQQLKQQQTNQQQQCSCKQLNNQLDQQLLINQQDQPQLNSQIDQQHLPQPKPPESQQTYQNITTQTVFRDAGGAGCNTVTPTSAFRFDQGSDCNYYENFISYASSQDQSLNRINSVTSFDNGYGGRMRDSQLDLFEYNRRHKDSLYMNSGLISPSTTETIETILITDSRSKRELKSERKELKRLLKQHPRKQPRSISATHMYSGKKESNTKIKLKEEVKFLKEKLKSIKSSEPTLVSSTQQHPEKLKETKSKHLLRDEICELKRRVKDQIVKQTLKWRKRFSNMNSNRNASTPRIPPRNSDRAVFDFRKFKIQLAQAKKEAIQKRNLAAPLENYPSQQFNSLDATTSVNCVSIQPRFYRNWLNHKRPQESAKKPPQEFNCKTFCIPPVKSVRQQLMQEDLKNMATPSKIRQEKLIKLNNKK